MGVNMLVELRRVLTSYFAPKILSAKENNAKFVSYVTEEEYLNALQRRINRVSRRQKWIVIRDTDPLLGWMTIPRIGVAITARDRVLVRLGKLGYRMSYGADGIHIAWDHV